MPRKRTFKCKKDLESYIICYCQLSISYLFLNELEKFREMHKKFLENNVNLRNSVLENEMNLISGFIATSLGDYGAATEEYKKSLAVAN